jgi:hypothetical protein
MKERRREKKREEERRREKKREEERRREKKREEERKEYFYCLLSHSLFKLIYETFYIINHFYRDVLDEI